MNFNQELSRIQAKLNTPLELRNFELFKYALQANKAKAICNYLARRANHLALLSVLCAALCAYSYSALLSNVLSGGTFAGAIGLYLAMAVTGGGAALSLYLRYVLLSERKAIADVCAQSIGLRLREAYQTQYETNIEPEPTSIAQSNEDADLASFNRR